MEQKQNKFEYLKRGGYRETLISVWELLTGQQKYEYFKDRETTNVKRYSNYNTGKNPLKTTEGVILSIWFDIFDQNFKKPDWSNNAVRNEIYQLLNQCRYEVRKDSFVVHKGIVIDITKTNVPDVIVQGGNNIAIAQTDGYYVANRPDNKSILYLPIEIKDNANSFDLEVNLPTGGYSITGNLNGYLLVAYMEAIQYPKGK